MCPVKRSPPQGRTTPALEDTPSPGTLKHLSGTPIPESPTTETTAPEQNQQIQTNLTNLLVLLTDAIGNIGGIKTTTGANPKLVASAKLALEQAKTITQNLLKEEEEEKQQTIAMMSKELKDIKRMLEKPTFAQMAATPPRHLPGKRARDIQKQKEKKHTEQQD